MPVTLHLSRSSPCDSTRRSPLSPVTSGAEAGKEEEKSAQLGTEAGENGQNGSFVCVWVIYFGRQALIYAAAATAGESALFL